jgi:hypothetical protein
MGPSQRDFNDTGRNVGGGSPRRSVALATALMLMGIACVSNLAKADEGGVGFWLPGLFGSLAAAPQVPGWSLGMIYIHDSVSAGANVATARAITIGQFNPTLNLNLNANLKATSDIGVISPQYVFATPFLGGQAAVSLAAIYGNSSADINGTLSGTLGPIPFSRAFDVNDSRDAFGDLFPQFTLRWNAGVNNWMTYVTGDIPVGAYDSARLANLGLGHGAIDAGAGYTYFDPKTGYEFSTVAGLTYNLINPSTDYQNGVDFHLDWGASKFLTKQWQIGLVGYFFNQISCDSGAGDKVGCFESRVAGIGPQIGYIFPINERYQGYINLKGFGEFAAEHRAEGWNTWLTFAISPAPPSETATAGQLIHK